MIIVYAHPNKKGNCGYMLECVEEELTKKNINYDLWDLYGMKYDPILSNKEHYTSGGKDISKENKKLQEAIKEERKFIFIYPTWWSNMPAILKGFIDRVFIGGYAFKFKGKMPVSLLKGKAVVFSTTGAPRIFTWLFQKDRSVKNMTKDILGFCGIKSHGYIVGNANRFNESQKGKIEKVVLKGLKKLI